MATLVVRTNPPSQIRTSAARWFGESATFRCTIAASVDTLSPARSLSDQVDAILGIKPATRRLVINRVDILVDDAGRPTSIDVFTNPAQWRKCPAEEVESVEAADVVFDADWDSNGIASFSAPSTMELDTQLCILTMRFGRDVVEWTRYADGLLVGLGADQALAAIRFERVAIDEATCHDRKM